MSLLIPGTNSIKDTGYDVDNSLRFNDGSSDYLSISGITPTNSKKFTYSFWVKRTTLNADQAMLSYESDSNNRGGIELQTGDLFRYFERVSGSTVIFVEISSLFTDPSAWYNIIVATDTTQSTESDRVKIYVNGVLQTSFATSVTYPSLNSDTRANGSTAKNIGRRNVNNDYYFDGYLAEVVFIDGSQLDQTSFGEFDSDSPRIWKPKDVSGLTFGNAGFYLDFENSSSLGADVSGNSNNFTVNNLTAVDQSTDTCTNNFATMNPLDNYYASATFSEGNLKIQTASSPTTFVRSAIGITANFKCYWEAKFDTTQSGNGEIGIVDIGAPGSTGGSSRLYYQRNGISVNDLGQVWANNSNSGQSLGTLSTSDIIGFAWDGPNSALYVRKNDGAWLNSGDPTSGSSKTGAFTTQDSGIEMFPAVGDQNGSGGMTASLNFGSAPYSISSGNSDGNGHGNFEYAVPSGYFALCTKNLAENG